jgi:hypothetical protein
MFYPFDTCEGPIQALYLPQRAWEVLHREKIGTMAQLRAAAGRLEQFEGIGPKMAHAIRLELDRVAAPGEQTFGEERISVWCA